MKKNKYLYIMINLLFFLASVLFAGNGFAGEYVALDGLKKANAVFDVRGSKVKPIALQLDLIHKTFHDVNVRNVSENPDFAIVFGGGAVKLLSSKREGYSDEEKRLLELIADKLSAMAKDGIRLEICQFAADVHDVDLTTVPSIIHRVDNGWISLIGYQQHGYSLVAVF